MIIHSNTLPLKLVDTVSTSCIDMDVDHKAKCAVIIKHSDKSILLTKAQYTNKTLIKAITKQEADIYRLYPDRKLSE